MKKILFILLAGILISGCSKGFVDANVAEPARYYSETFNTTKDEAYYALRWAFKINGYPLAIDNKSRGVVETSWAAVTPESHYINVFGRKDTGVTGTFHQLIGKIVPENGKMKIEVGSRTKSVVAYVKSSGVEEREVLNQVARFLRKREPKITNIGLEK